MQWASVSTTEPIIADAITQAADRLMDILGQEPDLVFVFVATNHRSQFSLLPSLLRQEFTTATVLGSLCQNSIGEGREHEDESTITLFGASLPDVKLQTAHLAEKHLPPTYAERSLWDSLLHLTEVPECMVVLAAPFTIDTELFLKGLDRHYPTTTKLGGLASGVDQSETPCLLLNDQIYTSGIITLAMSGDIAVDTLVAQGCRPIGDPMFANNTHENLIIELDGKVPRDVLTELHGKLDRADRQLFTNSLFLGIAMEAQREHYAAGDFLIRAILGLDPQSGALWINSPVPTHSVVQLHVRDAATSAQELEQILQRYRSSPNSNLAASALLFSCTGRGVQLYGHANHDTNAFKQALSDIPLAGCFCNGEIGQVRGLTYLHSFSSVFGIFRNKASLNTH